MQTYASKSRIDLCISKIQREREALELYVEARKKFKGVRESERIYKLVLSWLFFMFVMLSVCFALVNNNTRVKNLSLP